MQKTRRKHTENSAENSGSLEAEYYSVLEMAIEMIYLQNLLANMGLLQENYTEVFDSKDNTVCTEW